MAGILDSISSRIKVDADQLERLRRQLEEQASADDRVLYVLKRPSYLEMALVRRLCTEHKLPIPSDFFSAKDLARGVEIRSAVVSMHTRTGHEWTLKRSQRYRKVFGAALKRMVREEPGPGRILIPISFFAGLGPNPWPRPLRLPIDFSFLPLADLHLLLVFLVHRRRLMCDLGPALFPSTGDSGSDIVRHISLEMFRMEKRARGAKAKDPTTVEGIVLSGERFEHTLQELAQATGETRARLYQKARKIFSEIAATMKGKTIRMFSWVLRAVIGLVFSRVETVHIERLRESVSRQPTVLLPSHRSHFDYLLMSYILFFAKLPLPYIAAGVNLNFWPVGRLFRTAGGFFIRRRTAGDILYKVVLQNYLTYLIKNGELIQFFIEGGRSRSGGMRVPRLGLLKYLVQAWDDGGRKDLSLVPVAITYERVAEEESIARELAGGKKRKEDFLAFLRLRKVLRKRFGSVRVVFGEPFSLRAFRDVSQGAMSAQGTDVSRLTEDLGFAVSRSIMDCTALTGTALVAAAALSFPEYSFSEEKLKARMCALLQVFALKRGMSDAFGGKLQEALDNSAPSEAVERVIRYVVSFGYLRRTKTDTDVFIEIPPAERLKLDYYKNGVLHFFVVPGFVAQALSLSDRPIAQVLFELHRMFHSIFLLPKWEIWCAEVERFLRQAAKEEWLEADPDLRLDAVRYEARPLVSATEKGAILFSSLGALFRPLFEVLYAAMVTVRSCGVGTISQSEFLNQTKVNLVQKTPFPSGPRDESATTPLLEFSVSWLRERAWAEFVDDSVRGSDRESRRLAINVLSPEEFDQTFDFISEQITVLNG